MTGVLVMVVAALFLVESEYRPDAVGTAGEVGILQITPAAVAEANRIVGELRWVDEDRTDVQKSIDMCWVTLEWHYRRGVTNPVDLAGKWRNPFSECPEWYRERVTVALYR
jgi:hypothetical protein